METTVRSVGNYSPNLNGPYTNTDFHARRSTDPAKSATYIPKFEPAWVGQRKLAVGHDVKRNIRRSVQNSTRSSNFS